MGTKCPRCGKLDTVHEVPEGGYTCSLCRCTFGGIDSFDKSIIRSLTLNIKPVFVNSWTFSIREKGEDAYFDSRYGSIRRKGNVSRECWEAFLSSLLENVYINSWKPMYFSASELKGVIWDLSIKLKHKHSISYKGVGCLPPYWEEFVSIIKALIKGQCSEI